MVPTPELFNCPLDDIASYVDGELSPDEETEFEAHLAGCETCRTELNHQKEFLFALSSSLESENDIPLPKDFTRTIVANAESRVSGLRRPRERFTAIFICAVLFIFAAVCAWRRNRNGIGRYRRRRGKGIGRCVFCGAAAVQHFIQHRGRCPLAVFASRSFLGGRGYRCDRRRWGFLNFFKNFHAKPPDAGKSGLTRVDLYQFPSFSNIPRYVRMAVAFPCGICCCVISHYPSLRPRSRPTPRKIPSLSNLRRICRFCHTAKP